MKRQIVTVTQDILKGGSKMLDIFIFVCSLKCSWIKRLTPNYKTWVKIFIAINSSDSKWNTTFWRQFYHKDDKTK